MLNAVLTVHDGWPHPLIAFLNIHRPLLFLCQRLRTCLDEWLLWSLQQQRRALTLRVTLRRCRLRAAWRAWAATSRLHGLASTMVAVCCRRAVGHAWCHWRAVVSVRREIERTRREAALAAERQRQRDVVQRRRADDHCVRYVAAWAASGSLVRDAATIAQWDGGTQAVSECGVVVVVALLLGVLV